MKQKNIFLSFLFLCLSVFLSISVLYAEDPSFTRLKDDYFRLRNTDPQVLKTPEWQAIARGFVNYVNKYPRKKESPSALNNASIVYEQLYNTRGDKYYLAELEQILDRIIREYSKSGLADDALWKKAEIALSINKDKKTALLLLNSIVKNYRLEDKHDAALIRIEQIETGKFDSPVKIPKTALNEEKKEFLVVIDPGHGGEDLGAVGKVGLLEKDVVLDIAFEIERLLKNSPNIAVKLTRRSDTFVPLSERTSFANENKADLFISLHVNSAFDDTNEGLEIYYLDNTKDKSSLKMAERENASINYEGATADLYLMLSDMIQNSKLSDSLHMANIVNQQIEWFMKTRWQGLKNRGVKKAPFYVLVGVHSPCILAELYFINNVKDGSRLGAPKFRKDLALALVLGIKKYLRVKGQSR